MAQGITRRLGLHNGRQSGMNEWSVPFFINNRLNWWLRPVMLNTERLVVGKQFVLPRPMRME
jgi:hypothetical protein